MDPIPVENFPGGHMKGIVFNLLEEVVTAEKGEAAWDELLEAAGLEGAYTSLGNYDDRQMAALVRAASEAVGASPEDTLRWFGRKAMPQFAARYPRFFAGHTHAIDFLLTLNEVIHADVRKLYPGAQPPRFVFERSGSDDLRMEYHSSRSLCALAEGLIQGAAAHFGQAVEITQPECRQRGDARCVLSLRFASARAA